MKLRKGGCPGSNSSNKKQTVGIIHRLTAAMHRNIFAIGLLGGKSADVTNENAIMDLHIERKDGETNEQGSDRKQQSDKKGSFP